MELIDKSTLVVEIEKEIKDTYAGREYVGIPSWDERKIDGLEKAIEILNTLEVKEVDLEKEVDKWYQNKASKEFENVFYDDIEECAKHFFELGLKAKGE